MKNDEQSRLLLNLTTEIVASYAENNSVPSGDLPALIASVHQSLSRVGEPMVEAESAAAPKAATTARKSLSNPDKIVSMIDGMPYSMLTRHIKGHGYTPASYRQAFGLPADYPMTASGYSAKRSELAKAIGLGRKEASVGDSAPAAKGETASKPKTLQNALAKSKEHLGTDREV